MIAISASVALEDLRHACMQRTRTRGAIPPLLGFHKRKLDTIGDCFQICTRASTGRLYPEAASHVLQAWDDARGAINRRYGFRVEEAATSISRHVRDLHLSTLHVAYGDDVQRCSRMPHLWNVDVGFASNRFPTACNTQSRQYRDSLPYTFEPDAILVRRVVTQHRTSSPTLFLHPSTKH